MDNIDFNSTKLTQALVKCKSVTPADDGALEIVEKHLSSIGFKCTPLLFTDPNSYDVMKASLNSLKKKSKKSLILISLERMCHVQKFLQR